MPFRMKEGTVTNRIHRSKYPSPHKKGEYLKMGKNDIGKKSIPVKDRCEDFDRLWDLVYYQVLETWDWVPVTNVAWFKQFAELSDDEKDNYVSDELDTTN